MPSTVPVGWDNDLLTPATMGLALAMVRSKPPHTSIDDHLKRIIENMKGGSASQRQAPTLNIDTVGYWKAQFDQAEYEKASLEDEVWQLRDELHTLKQTGRAVQKRKPDNESTTKANTQSKRRRRVDDSDNGSSDNGSLTEPDPVDPEISGLLRALLRLQQMTTSDATTARELQAGISRLCSAVLSMLKREAELLARVEPIYACAITAVRSIYGSNLPDNLSLSSACNSIVKLFQALLGLLHQTALDEVGRKEHEELRKSKKPKSNSKVAKVSGPEEEQRCHSRLAALTQLMTLLFAMVEISVPADNELYEAVVIALFDHIGSSVSLLVFIDPQTPDAGLVPVRGLLDVAHIEPAPAIATAQLSAPYLIRLMKAALNAAKVQSHKSDGKDLEQMISVNRSPLLHRVEERLQHTLLRGIFGEDDGSFKHAFVRREGEDDMGSQSAEEQEDTEQSNTASFIGQVWEMLGWDILSGNTLHGYSHQPSTTSDRL